jgi:hypothetical protein
MRTLVQIGMHKRISGHSRVSVLEEKMAEWSRMPLFEQSKDAAVAEDLLSRTWKHAYVFARLTMPSYSAHLFFALRQFPPSRDGGLVDSRVLARNVQMIEDELFTNNMYRRDGERHAHVYDVEEALYCAHELTFEPGGYHLFGYQREPSFLFYLETPVREALNTYYDTVQELTKDPLTTFLMVAVSEVTIPETYLQILPHLTNPRFERFCRFMRQHVALDGDEHGPASVDWLNMYLNIREVGLQNTNEYRCLPQEEAIACIDKKVCDEIDAAIENTIAFTEARIATYT